MDVHGLPLVGPGIDYTKVEAINQKRTIAFINHFIVHTSRFLNRFSYVCEEKLEALNTRIQQLEISLSLLEAKLSSIPGLENVTIATSSAATGSSSVSAGTESSITTATSAVTPGSTPGPPAVVPEPEKVVVEAQPEKTVSQDPRYMKYFKMLQVGVPEPAVRGKMAADGLNPDLLNTPDAPAPLDNIQKEAEGDSSDDSLSDSDASFSD